MDKDRSDTPDGSDTGFSFGMLLTFAVLAPLVVMGADEVAVAEAATSHVEAELSKVNSLKLFSISSFLDDVFITRWVLGLASSERFSKPVLRRRDTRWCPAMLLLWLLVFDNRG